MVIDRMPTELNILDLPSRCEYQLLEAIECQYVEPSLDKMFWNEAAWDIMETLSVKQSPT